MNHQNMAVVQVLLLLDTQRSTRKPGKWNAKNEWYAVARTALLNIDRKWSRHGWSDSFMFCTTYIWRIILEKFHHSHIREGLRTVVLLSLCTGHHCRYQNIGPNTSGCCACPIYGISRTVTTGITPTISHKNNQNMRRLLWAVPPHSKSMRAVWNYWIVKISVPNAQSSISSAEVFHVVWRKMFEIVTYSLHRK